jgi:hypothetical protein
LFHAALRLFELARVLMRFDFLLNNTRKGNKTSTARFTRGNEGSWNRVKRTGYKVVRAPFDKSTGKTRGEYEDFVTGFVTPEGKVWGRPVGITVAKDGSLLVSEDGDKTIWRVSYK